MAMDDPQSSEQDVDSLSQLQRKLDDLGVMFYTYVGIMQRDAPPAARPPDENDEIQSDEIMRKELSEKAPEYAKDIGEFLIVAFLLHSMSCSSSMHYSSEPKWLTTIHRLPFGFLCAVRTHREIDEIINQVEKDLQPRFSNERTFLEDADKASVAAGTHLTSIAEDAKSLLANIREVIATRDHSYGAEGK